MDLRLVDRTGLAGFGDDLPALDAITAFHEDFRIMGIGRDPTIVVSDQNEVAIALELGASVGDRTGLSGVDFGPVRDLKVETVVVSAVRTGSEPGNDPSANRPA